MDFCREKESLTEIEGETEKENREEKVFQFWCAVQYSSRSSNSGAKSIAHMLYLYQWRPNQCQFYRFVLAYRTVETSENNRSKWSSNAWIFVVYSFRTLLLSTAWIYLKTCTLSALSFSSKFCLSYFYHAHSLVQWLIFKFYNIHFDMPSLRYNSISLAVISN